MPIRKIYFLPNLITASSLLCGLLAIMHIVRGEIASSAEAASQHFIQACWFIVISALLDGMDGAVARWTHTESSFGLNFDSLSDLVAFGVAPAFLMFAKLNHFDRSLEFMKFTPKLADAVVALYVICGALRLARFNVQVAHEEKRWFTGLPIPAAAGAIVSTYLVVNQLTDSHFLFRAILILMVLLSFLMVSAIPFHSLKNLHFPHRRAFDLLVASILLACIVIALRKALEFVMFATFWGYIGFTGVRHLLGKSPSAKTHPAAKPETDPAAPTE